MRKIIYIFFGFIASALADADGLLSKANLDYRYMGPNGLKEATVSIEYDAAGFVKRIEVVEGDNVFKVPEDEISGSEVFGLPDRFSKVFNEREQKLGFQIKFLQKRNSSGTRTIFFIFNDDGYSKRVIKTVKNNDAKTLRYRTKKKNQKEVDGWIR